MMKNGGRSMELVNIMAENKSGRIDAFAICKLQFLIKNYHKKCYKGKEVLLIDVDG